MHDFDLVAFLQETADMLAGEAGIYETVCRTLPCLPGQQRVLMDLYHGRALAAALSNSEAFTSEMLALIAEAEQSDLAAGLQAMARNLYKQQRQQRRRRKAKIAAVLVSTVAFVNSDGFRPKLTASACLTGWMSLRITAP